MSSNKRTKDQSAINENNAPNFSINLQYLKDISFENPTSPAVFFQKNKEQPQLKVNVDVLVNKINESSYEVILGISADATMHEDKIYILELKYAAIVAVLQSLTTIQIKRHLMVDVPTLLLPFARQIIATIVRDGGFTALVLDPINFEALYKQHTEQN
ncbi:Protein-export protein SecB [Candidatus Xenohaliotis californiensis]|uniref:Protein-export protein SecB n=1 Tax=Candidatus Xenohaliotis californiensis TaxID=84677 RepID=A0ABP0ESL2_9RICK|nr:Protein-export protein SecB [Candidatus Xenohaliotis californiensis]